MKIALGTTSIEKKNIFEASLKVILPDKDFEIISCKVDSEITEQPLDKATTIEGSVNRAKNAFKQTHDADLAIGLEAGLVMKDNIYGLLCICSIIDKKGKIYTGESNILKLPLQVSDAVLKGKSFGKEIREFVKNTKDQNLKILAERLISRKVEFKVAIKSAFEKLKE